MWSEQRFTNVTRQLEQIFVLSLYFSLFNLNIVLHFESTRESQAGGWTE